MLSVIRLSDSALVDAGYVGSPYTRYSRRLPQHLDRVLVPSCWLIVFPQVAAHVDHAFRVPGGGPSELAVPDDGQRRRLFGGKKRVLDGKRWGAKHAIFPFFGTEAAIPNTIFGIQHDVEYLTDPIASDSGAGVPGGDGYFFHTCWEIISENVFGAVTEFFHGVEMPKGFTATTISLISKAASPTCWSEYRPISLCNVTNKICTKLMTIHIGHVLSKVLRRKGFPQRWNGLVSNVVSHCWLSVLVNDEHAGFFHSTLSLRQGDSLSPALFVLAADYLSRGLDRLFTVHPTMYYQAPGRIRASHLAYANRPYGRNNCMVATIEICIQLLCLITVIIPRFGIASIAFEMWRSLFSSGPWVKVLFLFGTIIGLERSL
ncbi:UNVERIFIED_CONTAM: hypothetical protein Sangu_2662700 [Sesamum angustifolium]|uniref:Reverse transcriptase n=1 Tax=Sesamum angustifolium TaxID=2727405 RepID=A0AAW2J1M3_9LAMI